MVFVFDVVDSLVLLDEDDGKALQRHAQLMSISFYDGKLRGKGKIDGIKPSTGSHTRESLRLLDHE